jgi:hypothetical protein
VAQSNSDSAANSEPRPMLAEQLRPATIERLKYVFEQMDVDGNRVKPRHRAISSGGNEPHFRPAGEVKKIVYENRGVFDKYYLLSHGTGGPGATMPVSTQGPDFGMAGRQQPHSQHKEPIQ